MSPRPGLHPDLQSMWDAAVDDIAVVEDIAKTATSAEEAGRLTHVYTVGMRRDRSLLAAIIDQRLANAVARSVGSMRPATDAEHRARMFQDPKSLISDVKKTIDLLRDETEVLREKNQALRAKLLDDQVELRRLMLDSARKREEATRRDIARRLQELRDAMDGEGDGEGDDDE